MRGTVKWFDDPKGYGWIIGEDGLEYFVHFSSIEATPRTLQEGQPVVFDQYRGPKYLQAVSVRPIPCPPTAQEVADNILSSLRKAKEEYDTLRAAFLEDAGRSIRHAIQWGERECGAEYVWQSTRTVLCEHGVAVSGSMEPAALLPVLRNWHAYEIGLSLYFDGRHSSSALHNAVECAEAQARNRLVRVLDGHIAVLAAAIGRERSEVNNPRLKRGAPRSYATSVAVECHLEHILSHSACCGHCPADHRLRAALDVARRQHVAKGVVR